MKNRDLIPVYHQGQPTSGEPDHYVPGAEMLRGLKNRTYMSVNRGTALLKLTTCLPKYKNLRPNMKVGWKGVATNIHSWDFRRDYGAFMRGLGHKTLQLVEKNSTGMRHSRMKLKKRIVYSLTQCADNNNMNADELECSIDSIR